MLEDDKKDIEHARERAEQWVLDWAYWCSLVEFYPHVHSAILAYYGTPVMEYMLKHAIPASVYDTARKLAERYGQQPPPFSVQVTLVDGILRTSFARKYVPDAYDIARQKRKELERKAAEEAEAAFDARCDQAAQAPGTTRHAWIRQVLEGALQGKG